MPFFKSSVLRFISFTLSAGWIVLFLFCGWFNYLPGTETGEVLLEGGVKSLLGVTVFDFFRVYILRGWQAGMLLLWLIFAAIYALPLLLNLEHCIRLRDRFHVGFSEHFVCAVLVSLSILFLRGNAEPGLTRVPYVLVAFSIVNCLAVTIKKAILKKECARETERKRLNDEEERRRVEEEERRRAEEEKRRNMLQLGISSEKDYNDYLAEKKRNSRKAELEKELITLSNEYQKQLEYSEYIVDNPSELRETMQNIHDIVNRQKNIHAELEKLKAYSKQSPNKPDLSKW